jgi:DnaJ family protein C protein 9
VSIIQAYGTLSNYYPLGSQEEIDDLEEAYRETGGSIDGIISHIPHSNHTDEDRFIEIINNSIKAKRLTATALWKKEAKDVKAKARRKAEGEAEAAEAEETAKELGVWDEFYGSGKPSQKRKRDKQSDGDEGDVSALKAIIQSRQKKMNGFFDDLAAKYSTEDSGSKGKGKGRKKRGQDDEPGTKGRGKAPDIDDKEFEALQAKLFGKAKVGR